MFVVFDLDGTLALTEHCTHFLNRPGREKTGAGSTRPAIETSPAIRTLLALDAAGAEVEIWSGRLDEVKDKTAAWLAEHGLDRIPIRTRAAGDHRSDTVLKAEWLDEGRKPDLIFEDRASVVAMWRARGIVVCQVAPGDF